MSRKGLVIILLLAMVVVVAPLFNNGPGPQKPSHQNSPPTPSTQGEDRMASQEENHPGSLEYQPSMGEKSHPSITVHGDPRKGNLKEEGVMEGVVEVHPKDPFPEPPPGEQDPGLTPTPPEEEIKPSPEPPPKEEVNPPQDPSQDPPKEDQEPPQEPEDPQRIQVEELNEDDSYGPIIPIIKGK